MEKFPVISLFNREFSAENRSQQTGPSAKQSVLCTLQSGDSEKFARDAALVRLMANRRTHVLRAIR